MNNTARINDFDLPINAEVCFSTYKNKFSKQIRKSQLQTLRRFVQILKRVMEPDEQIFLTVKGRFPKLQGLSFLGIIATGFLGYYIYSDLNNRCVLIFTNKRILHFPTTTSFSPRGSIAQIRYGDIEHLNFPSFFGRKLVLKYKSGKEERFHRIPPKEFQKLRTILPSLLAKATMSEMKGRHSICPKCTTSLAKGTVSCPHCKLQFKDEKHAVRFSILFPGGGYFYTKRPVLGLLGAITEVFLIIAIISGLIAGLSGICNGKVPLSELADAWSGAILAVLFLVFKKSISVWYTKNYVSECIPARRPEATSQSSK